GREVDAHAPHAFERLHVPRDKLAQRLVLALRRIGETDLDADVVAAQLDVLDALAGDEIDAGVGVDAVSEVLLNLGFGDGHGDVLRNPSSLANLPRLGRALINFPISPLRPLRCLPQARPRADFSSPLRCPTPTGRSISATSWNTSRPTSGCASS